jgi:hypothetical protein
MKTRYSDEELMNANDALQLTDQLATAALQLPIANRAALAQRILASLDIDGPGEPDPHYLEDLAAEVQRRADLVLQGQAQGREAGEALATLRASLAERRAK